MITPNIYFILLLFHTNYYLYFVKIHFDLEVLTYMDDQGLSFYYPYLPCKIQSDIKYYKSTYVYIGEFQVYRLRSLSVIEKKENKRNYKFVHCIVNL